MQKMIRQVMVLWIMLPLGASLACAQVAGDFASFQSGNWNDVATWQVFDGVTWTAPAPVTPSTVGAVYIQGGDTVTITADVTVDSVYVDSTSALVVNSGVTVSVIPSGNGYGIVVRGRATVNGTVSNAGLVYRQAGGVLTFANGSRYIHAQTSGVIANATWSTGSTCEVTGYTGGNKPAFGSQSYYNFIWNCPGQIQNQDLAWFNNTVRGDITILSTGNPPAQLRMTSPSTGSPNTITVNGNVNVLGGDFASNGSGSAGTITVNHHGNINVAGGFFSASRGSGTIVRWNLDGNFTASDTSVIGAGGNGTGNSRFVFTPGYTHVLAWPGVVYYASDNVNFEIPSGATVQLGTDWPLGNLIMSGGILDLNGHALAYGATPGAALTYAATVPQTTSDIEFPAVNGPRSLVLNNTAGVSIHAPRIVPGTLTLSGNGSYANLGAVSGYNSVTYAATVAQTTGPELPSSITNLTLNNANGVTLGAADTVRGTLTLTAGRLLVGANHLKARRVAGAATSYVVTDGTGAFTVDSIGTSPVRIPVGTLSSLNPVTVDNPDGIIDNFTVRVDTGVSYPSKCDPSHAVQRTWSITKDALGMGNPRFTFQWNAGEAGANMTTTNAVWKFDTSWTQVGPVGTQTDNGNGTYLYGGGVGAMWSISRFSVGDTGIVPVQDVPFIPPVPPTYVSSSGDDTNPGTVDLPFRTLDKALSLAIPGSVIYVRGGTYSFSSTLRLNKSGLAGSYVKIWAYQGEKPVLDFALQPRSDAASDDGVALSASYVHLKGFEVKHAGHNGIYVTGSSNIVEDCQVHDNIDSGVHMRYGASYNLVLNCDSYFNFDPPQGGNADGFSAKWEVGPGNVFKGCRSWNNSDDGWDLWMAVNPVEIDSCWSFRNGVDSWFTGSVSGNGNGFKFGGNYVATPNTATNCLSFDNSGNTGRGFDENHNVAGQTLYNCTAFRNRGANFGFNDNVTQGQHVIRNCVSYTGGISISSGITDHDSWTGFAVTDADFVSLDTAQALGPRKADGSLPDITLLHLAAGSPMINAGMAVGLPYNDSAPDLGAFETVGTPHGVAQVSPVPSAFALMQNFPNPFNPSTEIRFTVDKTTRATLDVFNVIGQKVLNLYDGVAESGRLYSVRLTAGNLSSGVYFYRLQTDNRIQTRKLVLLK